MAQVKNNIITQGLSGTLGDTLVFRQRGGRTYVSTTPKESDKEPSEVQKEHRARFQQAVLYARSISGSAKEAYQKKAEDDGNLNAYNVAIADFFHAPDIVEINMSNYNGQVNDTISVQVTDDFMVKRVSVEIYNSDSGLIEQSDAVMQENSMEWLFTATVENTDTTGDRIVIKAYDMPGNVTEQEENL